MVLKKLKDDQRREMALLGEQFEQTIAEMLQKQSVSVVFGFVCQFIFLVYLMFRVYQPKKKVQS